MVLCKTCPIRWLYDAGRVRGQANPDRCDCATAEIRVQDLVHDQYGGVIDWVGDTLLYCNFQFSMTQLRSMTYGMVASARHQILKESLLLQVDGEGIVGSKDTACPVVDWDRLVDNAAKQQVRWSFIDDLRNKNATSVQNPKTRLADRVLAKN
jgi:hypothetical protein